VNEDKSTRYHRLRRQAVLTGTLATGGALALLIVTGGAAALAAWAQARAGMSSVRTVLWFVVPLALGAAAVQFPLAHRTAALERRYDLSTVGEPWWWTELKAFGVGLVVAIVGVGGVWFLLRWTPSYWWLACASAVLAGWVGLAELAPTLVSRRLQPLSRPSLAPRLSRLAERAGARIVGVFEWHIGDDTRRGSARLAGLGRSRRILLSDTLLSRHSDDEVEVIVAHELAHHVHHDLWRALALEGALLTMGLYAADLALGLCVGLFGLTGKSDLAGVAIVVLVAGAAWMLLLPVANAVSRAQERRADRFALELTGNVSAFTSAVKRLAAQNLAEERPSSLSQAFFSSHPSIADRLEAARGWLPSSDGRGGC
jgi:STE24 endopeptidase